MGGLGSGGQRKPGRRRTVESCQAVLDVNRLATRGCLEPGWAGVAGPISLHIKAGIHAPNN